VIARALTARSRLLRRKLRTTALSLPPSPSMDRPGSDGSLSLNDTTFERAGRASAPSHELLACAITNPLQLLLMCVVCKKSTSEQL
jgi:hypothetical protein